MGIKYWVPQSMESDWKQKVNRSVLDWISALEWDLNVFIEFNCDARNIDFLLINKNPFAVFVVEAKNWDITVATLNAQWRLASGAWRRNPYVQTSEEADGVKNFFRTYAHQIWDGNPEAIRIIRGYAAGLRLHPLLAIKGRMTCDIPEHHYVKFASSREDMSARIDRVLRNPHLNSGLRFSEDSVGVFASILGMRDVDSDEIFREGEFSDTAPAVQADRNFDDAVFVGRAHEVSQIRGLTGNDKIYVFGMSRSGKTSLALKSLENRPHILISGANISDDSEEGILGDVLREFGPNPLLNRQSTFPELKRAVLGAVSQANDQLIWIDDFHKFFQLDVVPRRYIDFWDAFFRTAGPKLVTSWPIANLNIERLFSSGSPLYIGNIDRGAWEPLMEGFTGPAKDEVFAITGGHPHWTKYLCRQILKLGSSAIDRNQVESALQEIFKNPSNTSHFNIIYGEIREIFGEETWGVMKILLESPFPLNAGALLSASGLNESVLNEKLFLLTRYELIGKSRNGQYSVKLRLIKGFHSRISP